MICNICAQKSEYRDVSIISKPITWEGLEQQQQQRQQQQQQQWASFGPCWAHVWAHYGPILWPLPFLGPLWASSGGAPGSIWAPFGPCWAHYGPRKQSLPIVVFERPSKPLDPIVFFEKPYQPSVPIVVSEMP
jgi:hypothetical protein